MTKKRDLERELLDAGWAKVRSRGGHDKFQRGRLMVVVPRHKEIPEGTARRIRQEAGLDERGQKGRTR